MPKKLLQLLNVYVKNICSNKENIKNALNAVVFVLGLFT